MCCSISNVKELAEGGRRSAGDPGDTATLGDPVTVLIYTTPGGGPKRVAHRGTICGFEMWGEHMHIACTRGRKPPCLKPIVNEGLTWARGHSGPAVDALLAAEALR